MHDNAEQQAGGVDRDMPFAALELLRHIPAARPSFSVVFTLWVSITAALGLGSRPSRSRMYSHTLRQGGKLGGGGRWRRWQPVRTR